MWASEITWNDGSPDVYGGYGITGGGTSAYWAKPTFQSGLGASTTYRDVPDVALNAGRLNYYSGYWTNPASNNTTGEWYGFGGTSCASPLWAAFTALVNQQRAYTGKSALGFANPSIYSIATGYNYTLDFHDITSGNNKYAGYGGFSAGIGYDDVTGWGSFNGINLMADLAPLAWKAVGTGDFNGDGKPDIIWQDNQTGTVSCWFMNGATETSAAIISQPGVVPLEWQIVGVADMNGDGKPDLIWEDRVTGTVSCWFMNGTTVTGTVIIYP